MWKWCPQTFAACSPHTNLIFIAGEATTRHLTFQISKSWLKHARKNYVVVSLGIEVLHFFIFLLAFSLPLDLQSKDHSIWGLQIQRSRSFTVGHTPILPRTRGSSTVLRPSTHSQNPPPRLLRLSLSLSLPQSRKKNIKSQERKGAKEIYASLSPSLSL